MKIKQTQNNTSPLVPTVNSLLIDGECLLKQGFHGTKTVQTEAGSSGAIYHFFNIIRRFFGTHGITKFVVFWEGDDSRAYRQTYYPYYKKQRHDRYDTTELDDLSHKRLRIKQYIEELFIRQVEVEGCEADDGIAHYVVNSPGEMKTIYTMDRDLLQLLSPYVRVFLADKKAMITPTNFNQYFPYHYGNVGLMKVLAGDKSDNIAGLKGIGEDVVLRWFPELKTEVKDTDWIQERAKELLVDKKKSVQLQTIVEGTSIWGTDGPEYYAVMNRIINLKHPYVTDELKASIEEAANESLDPEGRGGTKVVMKMMAEDHVLNLVPKNDNGFLDFWLPFTTIIEKEKQFFKSKS